MNRDSVIDYKQLVQDAIAAGISRYIVGAVVRDAQCSVLLLKRPSEDFMGGIFELPSGKVESGESLLEALTRELKEETAMDLIGVERYLGFFDYVSKSGRATRQFNFLLRADGNVVLSEHDAFEWVGADGLPKVNLTDAVREMIAAA